jgi:phosphoglycolate phosphatase
MLDRDIFIWMLRDAGLSGARIQRLMPELVRMAQNIYVRRCPDLSDRVCPGVRRLLGLLQRRQVPMGLVTGNLTRIGWKKMENAGLRPFFTFGAFAELGKTRADLVRLALRHARERGWINGKTQVSLIGDHPNDINAAKANGVQSVSVATGLSPVEELLAHSPDVMVEDLRRLRLAALLGPRI